MPRPKLLLLLTALCSWLATAVLVPEAAHADCCSFNSVACDDAREHTLPACSAGTQTTDGNVSNIFECWTLGFIAIDPFNPLTFLIAYAAGELYCDDAGDTACEPNLSDAQCTDSDGDGLPDDWEINGADVDFDGTRDVDLPAFGADPNHKDLFLELDVMTGESPTRQDLQNMKAAFAAAPVDAGGIPNPDGLPGINLWIDTGALTDPSAAEDGSFLGSCADGIDNGGDGATDGADPDCLLGDNLGGGNQVPVSSICNLDMTFYTSKAANFAANRALVFRYGLSARGCDADMDGRIDSGGWGEIGGNDFVEFNHDGGTIMHELGHTLDLEHGGNEGANCKPNYVSVMNYDQQFGINQVGGGSIFDFSPPRFLGGRGVATLPTLVENALDESLVLDPTDTTNRFVYVNANGNKVRTVLSGNPNWNGDVDPPLESGLVVNIDTSATGGGPPACANTTTNGTLTGHDDWSVISLPFTQFGDSATGGINVVTEPEQTLAEMVQLEVDLNTTNLTITKAPSVNPGVAGTSVVYELVVMNLGPNPASEVVVLDVLPAGTAIEGASAGCSEPSPGLVSCALPELIAGDSITLSIQVGIEPGLVYHAGAPTTIENQCSVENLLGPDFDGSDNADQADILVLAVADLGVQGFAVQEAPWQALAGEPVEAVLAKTMTSAGPSSPMDVETSADAIAPAGSSAYAVTPSSLVVALLSGEQRPGAEAYVLECGEPGAQTFGFTTGVAPDRPDDSDPSSTNDGAYAEHTLDCVVPVAVNINPHRANNAVNLQGAIEVAVLTTQAGEYDLPLPFDAARIDPGTVRFGSYDEIWEDTGGASPHQGWFRVTRSYELDDVTRDADSDMLLKFQGPDTGLSGTEGEACVKGEFVAVDGERYRFFGCDELVLLPGN